MNPHHPAALPFQVVPDVFCESDSESESKSESESEDIEVRERRKIFCDHLAKFGRSTLFKMGYLRVVVD